MPITFNCPCGKVLRIADENAGKRIKCPACQAVGTAPSAAPVAPKFELVEDDEPPTKPAPAKTPPAAKKPVAKATVEDDGFEVVDDEDDKPKAKKKPGFSKGSRRDEDDDEEDEKPKKKKRRRDDDDDDEPRPRRRKSGDPDAGKKIMYLIGGLVLVLVGIGVGVYWWHSGPHTGRRPYSGYIFGGCCVVVGIGTAIKGITGNFGDDE